MPERIVFFFFRISFQCSFFCFENVGRKNARANAKWDLYQDCTLIYSIFPGGHSLKGTQSAGAHAHYIPFHS